MFVGEWPCPRLFLLPVVSLRSGARVYLCNVWVGRLPIVDTSQYVEDKFMYIYVGLATLYPTPPPLPSNEWNLNFGWIPQDPSGTQRQKDGLRCHRCLHLHPTECRTLNTRRRLLYSYVSLTSLFYNSKTPGTNPLTRIFLYLSQLDKNTRTLWKM